MSGRFQVWLWRRGCYNNSSLFTFGWPRSLSSLPCPLSPSPFSSTPSFAHPFATVTVCPKIHFFAKIYSYTVITSVIELYHKMEASSLPLQIKKIKFDERGNFFSRAVRKWSWFSRKKSNLYLVLDHSSIVSLDIGVKIIFLRDNQFDLRTQRQKPKISFILSWSNPMVWTKFPFYGKTTTRNWHSKGLKDQNRFMVVHVSIYIPTHSSGPSCVVPNFDGLIKK